MVSMEIIFEKMTVDVDGDEAFFGVKRYGEKIIITASHIGGEDIEVILTEEDVRDIAKRLAKVNPLKHDE